MDDSWDVEAVVQYRTYYRKEQWLIKWQGYGEDRNTWEPKEHLLEEWVQQQAEEVKQKAVEYHQRTGHLSFAFNYNFFWNFFEMEVPCEGG